MPKPYERRFQDEFYRVLANICDKYLFAGLRLSVRTEEPRLDGKRPDIIVLKLPEEVPVLVIETKRKSELMGRYSTRLDFDPYSPPVVGQALSYAALIKEHYRLPSTPLFATANWDVMVLFGPVDDPWKFLNKEYVRNGEYDKALEQGAYLRLIKETYLFDERNPLREEFVMRLLDTCAKVWQKQVAISELRKPIGYWLIDQLRYFVEFFSSYYVEDYLREMLKKDSAYYSKLDGYARKLGYSNGLSDIVGSGFGKVSVLARMMTYVLMNKIIFYKVLEGYYHLPELKPFAKEVKSSKEYLDKLNEYFSKAMEVSGNFEQIFVTGLYDFLVMKDEIYAREMIDDLIRLMSEVNIQEFGDIIGHVYEELIPPEERHVMGEFYTPKPIAELITKWCIRSGDDVVLGPGCGSGTFEVEAYWRLVELKTGKRILPSRDVHRRVLNQIYALDINSFPTQLTAINLAMKNVMAPVTDLNIIESDFFSIIPGQEILLPYKVQTPEGPKQRRIILPREGFDAVFGNPPYTRWTEIPENVKQNIRERLNDILSKYDLHADVARGKEPGIYIHFIMWAREFLKPGGRLGMIISDSWLQAIYGENFGRYLLENFKVKALIDISARVFPVPLIGTCILLLEKPKEDEKIDDNEVIFMYLPIPEGGSFSVDEILQAINSPQEAASKFWIKIYKQGEIQHDKRWINFLFNAEDFINILAGSPLVKRISDYFEPCRGNTLYQILVNRKVIRSFRDVGGESFFYLTEEEARRRNFIPEWVYPLLPSSNYMRFYTFREEDWNAIRGSGGECYLFLAHKPRSELPRYVHEYIAEGESSIYLRKKKGEQEVKTVNKSQASQARERYLQYFYGWYDLGGVYPAPIYVAYGVQYLVRFVQSQFPVALDHRVLALFPKNEVSFNEREIKAILAFLNSSWSQIQVETKGRVTGRGLLELDVGPLSDLMMLDVKKLDENTISKLASLFDRLEVEARKSGGADIKENSAKLFDNIIREIDYAIAEILNVSELVAEGLRMMIRILMERRLARAGEARRDAIRGREEREILEIPMPKKRRIKQKAEKEKTTSLNNYL
ncbi:MAG: N-6 DNA methylase [Nitrososphaerota archaeon]